MSTKSRYQLSMFLAAIIPIVWNDILVVFMHEAVHATTKIPADLCFRFACTAKYLQWHSSTLLTI